MNRSLAAKAERAKRQRREAGAIEGSKPLNRTHFTLAAANAIRAETSALIAAYTGTITHGPVGPKPEPIGKRRSQFQSATYGNGKRRTAAVLDWSCYSTDTSSRLIPAAR